MLILVGKLVLCVRIVIFVRLKLKVLREIETRIVIQFQDS
jgi:hypothetical protein